MKIIIVEDEKILFNFYKVAIKDNHPEVEVVNIRNLEELEKFASSDIDIADVIVMDGALERDLDTISYTEKIRKKFGGTMIANSSRYNKELIEAGCNLKSSKLELLSLLTKYIPL